MPMLGMYITPQEPVVYGYKLRANSAESLIGASDGLTEQGKVLDVRQSALLERPQYQCLLEG